MDRFLAGLKYLLLAVPALILIFVIWLFYLLDSLPPSIPVGQDSLQKAEQYLQTLVEEGTNAPSSGMKCKEMLLTQLRVNADQYTLKIEGETPIGDAHDAAEIAVDFPQGSTIIMGYYRGGLEYCFRK